MADTRTLTIKFKADGAQQVNETLRKIEDGGKRVYTQVLKDGELVSQSFKTVTGAAKTNWSMITALSTSYLALSQAIGPAVRWLAESAKAAREDDASIAKRNAAMKDATGFQVEFNQRLEEQAQAYSKIYGLRVEDTRAIQTQWAALGANAGAVEQLTKASEGLAQVQNTDAATAVTRLTNFLEGYTNTVKGTTLHVEKGASVHERWTQILKLEAVGWDELNARMDTAAGAADRTKTAWDEFKKSIGRMTETNAAVDGINQIADALNGLADYLNTTGTSIVDKLRLIFRIGTAAASGGITELIRYANKPAPTDPAAALAGYDRARTNAGLLGMMQPDPSFDQNKPPPAPRTHKSKQVTPEQVAQAAIRTVIGLRTAWAGGWLHPKVLLPGFERSNVAGGGLGSAMARTMQGGIAGPGGIGRYAHPYDFQIFGPGGGGDYPGSWATERMAPQSSPWGGAGIMNILSGFQGGGLRGAGAAAGSIFGPQLISHLGITGGLLGAAGGPIGSLVLGGLLGGIGKLFGHHKKQNRDGQSQATALIIQSAQLEDIRAAIIRLTPQLRQSGVGLNSALGNIRAQAGR